jgi:hypothetical protein
MAVQPLQTQQVLKSVVLLFKVHPLQFKRKKRGKLEKETIWRMDRPEAQLQVKYLGRSN